MNKDGPSAATLEDFWAIPCESRFHEFIGRVLTKKAAPTGEHGAAQAGIVGAIRSSYHRKPDGTGFGGWWIATDFVAGVQ